MALKADRHELDVDISFFYNEDTAERGGVVVLDTVGSGAAMDQGANLCAYVTVASTDIPVSYYQVGFRGGARLWYSLQLVDRISDRPLVLQIAEPRGKRQSLEMPSQRL